ncbi:MAG: hypothetical protein KU37_08530 [Sulfuricurvum sp. PC08-66]|nr:MAG: hypothetical protein KU37_08530 [Sulfuricurvum sp. PC08-66]
MIVKFTADAKAFLFKNRDFIAKDNLTQANAYTASLIKRVVSMLQFPNIGKINAVFDDESIREIALDGMKIIYKIYPNSIVVLMVYRYINFDESQLES